MSIKGRVGTLIMMSFLMLGCNKQPVENETVDNEYKEEIEVKTVSEFRLETLNLENLETHDMMYTPYESDRWISSTTNNISYQIEEYYNENTMLYSYVLNVEEKELEENSGAISYKIIKIDVGALSDEKKGIFTVRASSPMYTSPMNTEKLDMNFTDQTYFLFSSEKRLFDEEFRVELVMIGEEDVEGDDYPETFRLVHSSRGENSDYVIVTD